MTPKIYTICNEENNIEELPSETVSLQGGSLLQILQIKNAR